MKKLTKIFNEIINEDLQYSHVDDASPEADKFEIGAEINESEDMSNLRFNDGRFNKNGANTIFMDDEPIVDFGVGQIGNVTIGDEMIPNALYLQGGYNAPAQRQGHGGLGLKFIFSKLPKIQHIILQCLEGGGAKKFWDKMGGKVIKVDPYGNTDKKLYTMIVSRS